MTKILIDEATVKLALDALRTLHDENMDYLTRNKLGGENNQCMVFAREAITALREAQPAQQEPVECANGCRGFFKHHPPAQLKPLTNGEIYTAYITATNQTLRPQDERLAFAFARAIEAAHNIKENT